MKGRPEKEGGGEEENSRLGRSKEESLTSRHVSGSVLIVLELDLHVRVWFQD